MLPDIKKPSGIRKTVQVSFGGIDLRPEAADGTFSKTINMTSDKSPVMASRPMRRETYQEGQVQVCVMQSMGDGIICNIDGFLYYNMIGIGAAGIQGDTEIIPFGHKFILPWTKEIVDLTVIPKGKKSGQAALPQNAAEGDAWLLPNQSEVQTDPDELWVRKDGAWVNTGPIIKSLEASATISTCEIRCGKYQGENAAWNTIRSLDAGTDFRNVFKTGDAVSISGCIGQPKNNQTLIVREVTKSELIFYENSFSPFYICKAECVGPTFDGAGQLVKIVNEDVYAPSGLWFQITNEILSEMSPEGTEIPDLMVYCVPNLVNSSIPGGGSGMVCFLKWDDENNQYNHYGSCLTFTPVPDDPQSPSSEYDPVEIPFETATEGPKVLNALWETEDQTLELYEEPNAITVSKKWPEGLQGVFANANRLWGWCGHQIRCSKLGDPSNWNFFDGVAEDAWAVDVHDPDAFTGGISVHGYPTFFTEHKRYRIYGSEPEAYQLGEQDCEGVRAGCGNSMVALDGALYYVSPVGVMQDTGSAPACVSEALGLLRLHNAVAGGCRQRYYVTGTDEAGTLHNLILDTGNGLWIDEGSRDVRSYAAVFGIMHEAEFTGENEDELTIWARGLGSPLGSGTEEGAISSVLETNDYTMSYPNRKRVHRVQLRFVLGSGASLAVAIQYDGDGTWVPVKSITGDGKKRSVYLPVIPRRCDHFRLKFTGSGEWELHSLALDLRQGSAMF